MLARVRSFVFCCAALWAPVAFAQDTGEPDPSLDEDDDNDGFTENQGDCDDASELVRPGLPEVCFDELDNDCNGLFDDGCDGTAFYGSLRGGGGCTGGTGVGNAAWLLLAPLALAVAARRPRVAR